MSISPKCKYFIQTYGCQMNTADSERLSGLLEGLGLSAAESWSEAAVVVLYSCSVRQAAEDKVFGWGKKIKEFNEANDQMINGSKDQKDISIYHSAGFPTRADRGQAERPFPLFILTGCMAGSARGERKRFSEKELKHKASFIDYILGPSEWEQLLPSILVREGLVSPERIAALSYQPKRKVGQTAFVNISEGCDNFCSYCVVPYGRGKEISRSKNEILAEARHLVEQGFHHLTLLGQNVNSWGITDPEHKRNIRINSDTALPFASLLREIHEINGIERLSFLTANPFDFTRDMVQALALPKVDRYLHMAVQSGSDTVLDRMNRRHTIAEYRKLIASIRKSVPDIELGTDIIVGFPGETEEEFSETLRLISDIRYNVVFTAMYSPRPGTSAATKYADDVPKAVKKERYARVQDFLAQQLG